jgi:hypothetical protein
MHGTSPGARASCTGGRGQFVIDCFASTTARLPGAPSLAAGVATFTRVCGYDRPGPYIVTVEQNGSRVELNLDSQVIGIDHQGLTSAARPEGAFCCTRVACEQLDEPGGGGDVGEAHHLETILRQRARLTLAADERDGVGGAHVLAETVVAGKIPIRLERMGRMAQLGEAEEALHELERALLVVCAELAAL